MDITSISITITRPDTSAPFFYESNIFKEYRPEVSEFSRWALENGLMLFHMPEVSEDGLTMTRKTFFPGESERQQFLESFSEKFPGFNQAREHYCLENNHIITREI